MCVDVSLEVCADNALREEVKREISREPVFSSPLAKIRLHREGTSAAPGVNILVVAW